MKPGCNATKCQCRTMGGALTLYIKAIYTEVYIRCEKLGVLSQPLDEIILTTNHSVKFPKTGIEGGPGMPNLWKYVLHHLSYLHWADIIIVPYIAS